LRVWQAARKFCQEISAILERPAFRRDFELRNQLNDAALSTMANIAELIEPTNSIGRMLRALQRTLHV
jgi:four helix bundle protein